MSTGKFDMDTFTILCGAGRPGDYLQRCIDEGEEIPSCEHMLLYLVSELEQTKDGRNLLLRMADFCTVPEDLDDLLNG